MKNKHRRQNRVKTTVLHGGRDRNAAITARHVRVKVLERLRDAFAAEAANLVISRPSESAKTTAREAVERVLARGGDCLNLIGGANIRGMVVDEESKTWWAEQVAKSIAPFVPVSKREEDAAAKLAEVEVKLAHAESERADRGRPDTSVGRATALQTLPCR